MHKLPKQNTVFCNTVERNQVWLCEHYTYMSGRRRLLQVIGIPIEMDTATATARTNRMGVATSSAIGPKPILQCKEDTLCTTSTFMHAHV